VFFAKSCSNTGSSLYFALIFNAVDCFEHIILSTPRLNTLNKSSDSRTTLRIAIAQINLLVGDIEGNTERIFEWIQRARNEMQADVIVFPELAH